MGGINARSDWARSSRTPHALQVSPRVLPPGPWGYLVDRWRSVEAATTTDPIDLDQAARRHTEAGQAGERWLAARSARAK